MANRTSRALLLDCRYLPPGASEYIPIWLDEDGAQMNAAPKNTRRRAILRSHGFRQRVYRVRLDFGRWLLAWDRYALAAAATKQMTFLTAMKHKETIMNLAMEAMKEGNSSQVAVEYDEKIRLRRKVRDSHVSVPTFSC